MMVSSMHLSMITCLLFLLSFFNLLMSGSSSSKLPLCHDDESSALSQFNQSFVINQYVSVYPSAYPKTASWKIEESNDCCSWDGVECHNATGHVIGLDLSSSFLYGSINSSSSLFRLFHLRKLNLADNQFNLSQIPSSFSRLSRLTYLNLSNSAFSGQIPFELSKLSKLASLDLSLNTGPSSESLLKFENPNLNSFLHNLTNLEVLDLRWVNISSAVPGILANFSSLTSLSLGYCGLQGEFPAGIFRLPNLQVLSVWFNPYLTGHFPEFNKSSPLKLLRVSGTSFSGKLPDSIGHLYSLKELEIFNCSFSGSIPSSLGNLAQLTLLDLACNNLTGDIPAGIFQLPNLQVLSVWFNPYLTGHFPDFNKSSPLKLLRVAGTSFSGKLPDSIGHLYSLEELEIFNCSFSGSIPSSLGNLAQLTLLDLSYNNLTGDIPSSLGNLTKLHVLFLNTNQLTGQIPSWLANLTQLIWLSLAENRLHGPIPKSIYGLVNLERLYLHTNYLSGTVEFDPFLSLKNLVYLQLSFNSFSLFTNVSINATVPKYKLLGLSECNLSEFPDFLRHQDELEFLELSGNIIRGQIPKWVWNIGKETLWHISVAHNFLTGFDQPPVVLPWTNLRSLYLYSNMIQGSLPIPPPSTQSYVVSHNSLTGELSPLICNLISLQILDLSNNNLSGVLPQCLGNFSDSLVVLNLGNNNFHGTIPQTFMEGSKLGMIDLSKNQFQGRVPRSLANCKMLQILDLGHNHINDNFPSWLGTIPELRVLIMRSNEFHGAIRSPESRFEFPMLRIVDLSFNSFTRKLPSEYFRNWNAMKIVDVDNFTYLQADKENGFPEYVWANRYRYSITIINKGIEIVYGRIPEIFSSIDLSSNKFEGDIPESIGNLWGLQSLNLSNNLLTGRIPSYLGNLTRLESLDLSRNKLSGEIPQQLVGLTFLALLNLSYNHLTGVIPHGNQFDTFENNSFKGNSGLCGNPLSKKCENSEASPPPPLTSEQDEDLKFPSGYDWIFILAGYGSGLVVGLVIGHIVTTRKHEWFVETFGRKPQKWQRGKNRGRRSTRS